MHRVLSIGHSYGVRRLGEFRYFYAPRAIDRTLLRSAPPREFRYFYAPRDIDRTLLRNAPPREFRYFYAPRAIDRTLLWNAPPREFRYFYAPRAIDRTLLRSAAPRDFRYSCCPCDIDRTLLGSARSSRSGLSPLTRGIVIACSTSPSIRTPNRSPTQMRRFTGVGELNADSGSLSEKY
jgi:hypothetical protein